MRYYDLDIYFSLVAWPATLAVLALGVYLWARTLLRLAAGNPSPPGRGIQGEGSTDGDPHPVPDARAGEARHARVEPETPLLPSPPPIMSFGA